jgi:hypothetical protein
MDSTCLKDSNGTLFVIFGHRNQKLWISKDLDEFWFQISIWIKFKQGTDMWQLLTGPYRFGRISDVDRRIKRDLSGPDHSIPPQLSDSFRSVWLRSNGWDQTRESLTGSARFPTSRRRRAALGWTLARLQGLLEDGVTKMAFGSMRGIWECWWRARSFPGEGAEGSRRCGRLGWWPGAWFAA